MPQRGPTSQRVFHDNRAMFRSDFGKITPRCARSEVQSASCQGDKASHRDVVPQPRHRELGLSLRVLRESTDALRSNDACSAALERPRERPLGSCPGQRSCCRARRPLPNARADRLLRKLIPCRAARRRSSLAALSGRPCRHLARRSLDGRSTAVGAAAHRGARSASRMPSSRSTIAWPWSSAPGGALSLDAASDGPIVITKEAIALPAAVCANRSA